MDVLDQEAHEDEALLARQPQLSQSRAPSHIANQQMTASASQYDATIQQARASDATVRKKWDDWESVIGILAGGEVRNQPQTRSLTLIDERRMI